MFFSVSLVRTLSGTNEGCSTVILIWFSFSISLLNSADSGVLLLSGIVDDFDGFLTNCQLGVISCCI